MGLDAEGRTIRFYGMFYFGTSVLILDWRFQTDGKEHNLSRLMTKPTKWHVRPAKTQISLGIRPVWSATSLCNQWVVKPMLSSYGQLKLWSDWADLSLRWAHMPFCWFCHETAHLSWGHICDIFRIVFWEQTKSILSSPSYIPEPQTYPSNVAFNTSSLNITLLSEHGLLVNRYYT